MSRPPYKNRPKAKAKDRASERFQGGCEHPVPGFCVYCRERGLGGPALSETMPEKQEFFMGDWRKTWPEDFKAYPPYTPPGNERAA